VGTGNCSNLPKVGILGEYRTYKRIGTRPKDRHQTSGYGYLAWKDQKSRGSSDVHWDEIILA
jgi:hypothetical protein